MGSERYFDNDAESGFIVTLAEILSLIVSVEAALFNIGRV